MRTGCGARAGWAGLVLGLFSACSDFSGTIDGGIDAGSDSFCGPEDFVTPCGQSTCPSNATCTSDEGCVCSTGYVALSCAGVECRTIDGGCSSQEWWCAPRRPGPCGPQNFDVPSDAGEYCATQSMFEPATNSCQCEQGTIPLACDGTVCSGDCAAPDWWCAPLTPGECGAQNFTVVCTQDDGGTYSCPTDATCLLSTGSCECGPGFAAVSCSGGVCEGTCEYPQWWCQ